MFTSANIARFGSFEANLEIGELRKHGLRIRLPEQAFQVLAMLLESPGAVVSRQELQKRLWPGQTYVDFEHGLNKAVNRLRDALNDSSTMPRFIETVSRRGYRFIAPVTRSESAAAGLRSAPSRLRLAVLPFENLSGDPEHEFFADGLTEEMISMLGRVSPNRLGIIARTSSMQYKRSQKSIDEIGRELHAEYILEGSVRKSETRVRINAQLIHASDQTHMWAETYNREMADILQVQHEVADHVASSLALELLQYGAQPEPTIPPEAYEAYLQGRFFWNKGTDRDAKTAIAWFEKALTLYPKYALAYSGMADCYGRLAWYGALPPREASPRAKKAATQALEIHDGLGEAHTSMALVCFWYEWNWPEAEYEFQRALDLKPNYAHAHNWYAAYLNAMTRFEEAAAQQKIAQELDPLSLTIAMNAADPYYFRSEFGEAIQYFQSVLHREPNFFPAHYNMGKAYALSGRYDEAITAFESAVRLSRIEEANAALAYVYGRSGQLTKAQAIQKRLEEIARERYVPAPQLVLSYLGLDNADETIQLLEKGFEERSYLMIYLKADPIYDSLRSHPGFHRLLEKMNFDMRWS